MSAPKVAAWKPPSPRHDWFMLGFTIGVTSGTSLAMVIFMWLK